jgi:hypothetical protein
MTRPTPNPVLSILTRRAGRASFHPNNKKSSFGKLWADPQFQEFMGNPDTESWTELFTGDKTGPEADIIIDQLKMLSGEVIMAFDLEHDDPYLIAAIQEDDFRRSLDMDEQLKEITEDPFDIVKDTFQDVEIIQHISNPGSPDETSSWQAWQNNTLVMGHSKEWVEKCIVQLKKDPVTEPRGNPALNANFPLSKLIKKGILESMAGKTAAGQQPSLYNPEELLDALGLMGLESLSFKMELRDAEMVTDANLGVADLTRGIFTILDLEPSDLPSAGFIPGNISSLEVGRFNLLRFWQEIPNVLASAMPSVKPQFDMILTLIQQQAGVDLEQDLLAYIDTKYFSFAVVEDEQPQSVIAVELKDGAAFKAGLESAFAAPAVEPQVSMGLDTEDFLDHTIYAVKNSDPGNPIAFGIAGDYLLYGHPAALRQVIRSETSGAAANKDFERSPLVKGLREHVPPRAFGYSAVDWKQNMAILVRELDKQEFTIAMQQNWAKSGSPLPPPDFNKLPPADHIASFFNVSYQYAEATANGIHQRIILKY